jgi:very-short-patch-repair endonuclease
MSKEPRTAASPPLPGRGERIQVSGFGNSSRKKSLLPKSATTARARNLRKNAPECERILWRELRNRKFANYKFRRQHPVDPYTLDFYCPALKLAIELDGSGHSYRLREQRDRVREEFLIKRGITVLRFWNHQVREELERCRSDLVDAGRAQRGQSLTFVLSICERERRNSTQHFERVNRNE